MLHERIHFLHRVSVREVQIYLLIFLLFGGGAEGGPEYAGSSTSHLQSTSLWPHALFIVIRWFVTDSFFYPVAAIFHMAWFTVPLHARLVDEWLLRGIILAHIPLPRAQRSALRGLTAFIQLTGLFI